MRIAYQGEPGAYSEAAALHFGGPHAETLPCKTFDEVFEAVVKKRATHGVVPLENSIGGTIHRNYDLLLDHELVDHRRGRARRRALPAGAARHQDRRREDRLLAPAGAGAVRAVPEGSRRHRRSRVRHGRRRQAGGRAEARQAPPRSPRDAPRRSSASRCCRRPCRTSNSTSPALRSSAAPRRPTPTRRRSCSRCRARPARSSRR